MPLCKNLLNGVKKYYKGDESTPRGRGYCAAHEKDGTRKRGKNGRMYVSRGNRWIPSRSNGKKKTSPRLEADNDLWTNPEWTSRISIKDLKIDDEIKRKGRVYYNLSGNADGEVVRFTYSYPNKFDTNNDGIQHTFDLMYPEDVEVPYGTNVWAEISSKLDGLRIAHINENFSFKNFEGGEVMA